MRSDRQTLQIEQSLYSTLRTRPKMDPKQFVTGVKDSTGSDGPFWLQ